MIEVEGAQPNIGRDALLRATALLWQAQDVDTDAMTEVCGKSHSSCDYRRRAHMW
jgi:hypothetical protein